METRAPYALIGAFVLVVIGAAFGLVYWLHNTSSLTERDDLPGSLRKYGLRPVDRRGRSIQRYPRGRSDGSRARCQ